MPNQPASSSRGPTHIPLRIRGTKGVTIMIITPLTPLTLRGARPSAIGALSSYERGSGGLAPSALSWRGPDFIGATRRSHKLSTRCEIASPRLLSALAPSALSPRGPSPLPRRERIKVRVIGVGGVTTGIPLRRRCTQDDNSGPSLNGGLGAKPAAPLSSRGARTQLGQRGDLTICLPGARPQ